MMDGAKFLNCNSLNGGRDRTRTCDLLRVKVGVQTKNIFIFYHLQTIICSVESKWSPNPSKGLRSSIYMWTPDAANITHAPV